MATTKYQRRGFTNPDWQRIYHSRFAEVHESGAYDDYYWVSFSNSTSKYYYGETAFQDYQRDVYDYELKKTLVA